MRVNENDKPTIPLPIVGVWNINTNSTKCTLTAEISPSKSVTYNDVTHGRMARTLVLVGRPLSAAPRLETSWWTAALASP